MHSFSFGILCPAWRVNCFIFEWVLSVLDTIITVELHHLLRGRRRYYGIASVL